MAIATPPELYAHAIAIEREHIELVARLLERTPEPALHTTLIFGK